jgi:hypothetical protein
MLVGILREHLLQVPPTEVAERAGHSVDVLNKVYAKCIYGQRDAINTKIEGLYK